MLQRVLIANRGEIACRIARTCARMGIAYVAVHSDADARSRHLAGAVEVVPIGASPPVASYLNIARLVAAAKQTGCDAVHPGYGFLSENSEFAKAVQDAGLIFVGPRPETIASLGDKANSKKLMRAAGVPVVPGSTEACEDVRELARQAEQVRYPVLLKPSAGGGGKGMAIVRAAADLAPAAEAAIRLARANFGDGRLLVERYVERPRHIEVQVFGDRFGNVVHAFERECSLQRRHQKVIEEAPSAALADETRAAVLDAAVRGASAVGYLNAGTFEFIVDREGQFFFMEVNTRLQVEHPVSEATLGLDFVEWQLRIASGEALPCTQNDIRRQGHAIEARIYAEDPAENFAPSPGTAAFVSWPAGVRVETALGSGDAVTPYYDPMVAKLIVHAADRTSALAALRAALAGSVLLGLTTNLGFLAAVAADPAVIAGDVDTGFLDARLAQFVEQPGEGDVAACAGGFAWTQAPTATDHGPWGSSGILLDRPALDPGAPAGRISRWVPAGGGAAALLPAASSAAATGSPASPRRPPLLDARLQRVRLSGRAQGHDGGLDPNAQTLSPPLGSLAFRDRDGAVRVVEVMQSAGGIAQGALGERRWWARDLGRTVEMQIGGWRQTLRAPERQAERADAGDDALAPMHGVVVAIPARVGATVAAGDVLAIIEAMKMENSVVASRDGVVASVGCEIGAAVMPGQVLVSLVPTSSEAAG